jgi:hypothetical protein
VDVAVVFDRGLQDLRPHPVDPFLHRPSPRHPVIGTPGESRRLSLRIVVRRGSKSTSRRSGSESVFTSHLHTPQEPACAMLPSTESNAGEATSRTDRRVVTAALSPAILDRSMENTVSASVMGNQSRYLLDP